MGQHMGVFFAQILGRARMDTLKVRGEGVCTSDGGVVRQEPEKGVYGRSAGEGGGRRCLPKA